MWQIGLTILTTEDMKEFDNLRLFGIAYSKITFLPRDLFIHNTKLEVFESLHNPIKHIDSGVFKHIQLIDLSFEENECCEQKINVGIQNDAKDMKRAIEDIEKACAGGEKSGKFEKTS